MRHALLLALIMSLLAVAGVGTLAGHAAAPRQATPTPPPVACPDCSPAPSAQAAMAAADAVFMGTVTTVTLQTANDWRREVQFAVERTWTSDTVGRTTTIDVPHSV